MPSRPGDDIHVSSDLAVRPSMPGTKAKFFEIRVGDTGWHRNAALLTKEQARRLRELLTEFIDE